MASTKFEKVRLMSILDSCKRYPNVTILLGVGSVYFAYYLLRVVKVLTTELQFGTC